MADERMMPGQPGWQAYGLQHLQRYQFALERVRGRRVLDLACGAGFGSFVLSQTAATCRGVDLAADAIAYAQATYRRANLDYRVGDALAAPETPGSVDVVVSFETIEHLPDPRAFVANVHAALAPGGQLIVSAPNTRQFSRAPEPRRNEFHLSEPTYAELVGWLEPAFEIQEEWEQSPVVPGLLAPVHREWRQSQTTRRLRFRRLFAAIADGLDGLEERTRRALGKTLPPIPPQEPDATVALGLTEIFPLLPERRDACLQFLFVCRRRDALARPSRS